MKTIQKKHQIVLLLTDEDGYILRCDDSGDKDLHLSKNIPNNPFDWSQHHLYILSDEEIKEGDWVYRSDCSLVFRTQLVTEAYVAMRIDVGGEGVMMKYCKKIIATTNPELTERWRRGEVSNINKLTDQFIQDWIAKGCPEFVNVEYEHKRFNYKGSVGNTELIYNLKISSDNTITCSFIKDDWGSIKDEYYKFIDGYKSQSTFVDEFNNWLKENYHPPTRKT